MKFSDMGLAPEILRALDEAGYENPTPIQEKAIPVLLEGRDVLGAAQTGTGKTAAFALPILHRFRNETPGKIRALVLVPTRELAIQVGRNIRIYSEHLPLRSTAVYGGVPMGPQEMALRYGVDILVATPGRLKDHMWRGNIDYAETSVLVLDEADRMLDMGFIDAVREIIREIPKNRQSMLFSATLDPEIQRLAKDLLHDPVRIEVAPPRSTAEGVEQVLVPAGFHEKKEVLDRLLREHDSDRTIIFTKTRRGAASLSKWLQQRGHRATSIHSDKTQDQRVAALEAFREGRIRLLVATDIAARGLDVDDISHVINFDLPHTPDDYVHRIGRTARAGKTGVAISLVGPDDERHIAAIEKRIGKSLRGTVNLFTEAYVGSGSNGSSHGGRGGSSSRGSSGRSASGRSSSGHSSSGHSSSGNGGVSRPHSTPAVTSRSTSSSNGDAPSSTVRRASVAVAARAAESTSTDSEAPKKRRRRRGPRNSGTDAGMSRGAGTAVSSTRTAPRSTAGVRVVGARAARENGNPSDGPGFWQRMISRLGLSRD